MKLTREQRQTLDKMSIKERVERLEECFSEVEEDLTHIRRIEFEKEFDKINEESDKQCMWTICIAMILIWVGLWVLLTKLAL